MEGADTRTVRVDAQPLPDAAARPVVSLVDVGPRYFAVVGAPVTAGQVFSAEDSRLPTDRVVVNEQFAQTHFPGRQALGQRILLEVPTPVPGETATPQPATLVGVVGNARQRLLPSGEFDPIVYRAYVAEPPQSMRVIARSAAGASAVDSFVRGEVQALDPDLPLVGFQTIAESFAQQFSLQRAFISLFGMFAIIAILLATSGLYGVTSYAVARRTREIGVRVALGADARRVWWATTGTTLRQLGIGVALGAAGAAALATVLPAMLVGTAGADPVIFALVALALVAVGVLASAIPARRATRVDPVTALQCE